MNESTILLNRFFSIKHIQTEGSTKLSIELNPQHEVYLGHFPGMPVAPGVCLVQMVKESVQELTQKTLQMQSCSNIKFTAVLDPNVNRNITLQIDPLQWNDAGELPVSCVILNGDTKFLSLRGVYKAIDIVNA